jgi:hypothetical protein
VRISIKVRSVKQAPLPGRIYDCNRLRLSHWQTAFTKGGVHNTAPPIVAAPAGSDCVGQVGHGRQALP